MGRETYKTPAFYPCTSLSTVQLLCKDMNDTHSYWRVLCGDITCRVLLKMVKNVEYMSKDVFTNMSEVHHLVKTF